MLIRASFMVWYVFFHHSQGTGHKINVKNGLIVNCRRSKAYKSIIFGTTIGVQKVLVLTLFRHDGNAFSGSCRPESIPKWACKICHVGHTVEKQCGFQFRVSPTFWFRSWSLSFLFQSSYGKQKAAINILI